MSFSKAGCSHVPKSYAAANRRLSPVTLFQLSIVIGVVDGWR
jgi:hypothetical protein